MNVQISARHLAQLRMVASKAKLKPGLAEAFADGAAARGMTLAQAEAALPGVLFLASGALRALDDPSTLKLVDDFLAELTGGPQDPANPANPTALASQILLSHLAAQDAIVPVWRGEVGNSWDKGQGLQPKMTDGLLARMLPSHKPTIGAEFAGMTLVDFAEMSLRQAGERVQFLSPAKKIQMAGMHTTSDFSISLGNTVHRLLLQQYEAAQSALKALSKAETAKDFRPITAVRFTAGLQLLPYGEGGEIKAGTLDEGGETLTVGSYGKIFNVSLQALMNDDLGVFGHTAQIGGTGAALTEASLFASLLTQNSGLGPTMSDTFPLFNAANHANYTATGTVISVASLGVGLLAMRRQTGVSGEKINVVPAYLVVPPELEVLAKQMVTQITPALPSSVNPLAGTLEVLVDPNLTNATRWYLVAKPGSPAGLRHAYLDGMIGPQTDQMWDFKPDMLSFRVREYFGCGFADWRAWYSNIGA